MRVVARTLLVTTSLIVSASAAFAADMTSAEIKTFLSGKTAYLETTAASAGGAAGKVVIFWGADGTALYKTPSGTIMHGTWETKTTQIARNGRSARGLAVFAMTKRAISLLSSMSKADRRAPKSSRPSLAMPRS